MDGEVLCDELPAIVGIEKDSIGIANESTKRSKEIATQKECVFCSHDPFSVNIEPKSLKREPNEKAFTSIVSISKLSPELESLHRLSFGSAQ
jgi:hypothetical protein